MIWKDILKENRLISQNVTHTKVDENDPEQEDDRCRKKLEQVMRDIMKIFEDNKYFTALPRILRGDGKIPLAEEECCKVLEFLNTELPKNVGAWKDAKTWDLRMIGTEGAFGKEWPMREDSLHEYFKSILEHRKEDEDIFTFMATSEDDLNESPSYTDIFMAGFVSQEAFNLYESYAGLYPERRHYFLSNEWWSMYQEIKKVCGW